jgi:hypothetical protein
MQMALDGSKHVKALVQTAFNEGNAEVSDDGRWLVYESERSGQQEIYVSPYPNVKAGLWNVSNAGGSANPLWAPGSRELFFMAPDGALMGVQVRATGKEWAATSPVKVLDPGWSREALIGRPYDISRDGKRFLVMTPPREVADPPELVVIQHWDQELEERVGKK